MERSIHKRKIFVTILESESLEKAKQKYLESNERFVSAVNKITIDNYNSLEQNSALQHFTLQAIEDYNFLMGLIGIIK